MVLQPPLAGWGAAGGEGGVGREKGSAAGAVPVQRRTLRLAELH